MGDGDISNSFREKLERDIDGLQVTLKQANEKNKPVQHFTDQSSNDPSGTIIGAAVGGAVGGPVGAVVGGIVGGLF